jgi:hypothetical protein
MKKLSIYLLIFTLVPVLIFAQEKNSKQPCLKVSSFSSSLGFGGAFTSNTDNDYYILKDAVENPALFIDITNYKSAGSGWDFDGMYSYGGIYTSGGSGNGNLLFNIGLTPYSKKLGKYRDNREIRFSVGGSIGTRNNFYYYDNVYTTIDTFQSVNSNELVYADSVVRKHVRYSLDFSEINFGVSYLFKTDVSRRVHFYTGVGANYGIALRSTVYFNEDDFRSVYYYDDNNKPSEDEDNFFYNDNFSSSYSEDATNLKDPMQFARVYIPLSVNLRLSKKPASFFSHVDLYTEISPGVEFQFLSGEKTYANPYVGFAFIGFRYHW